jgi:hypothetical protein
LNGNNGSEAEIQTDPLPPVFRDLRDLTSLLRRINSPFRLHGEFARKRLDSWLF